jgi:hypothetical protein
MATLIDACLMKIVAAKAGLDHYVIRLTLTDGFHVWYRVFEKTQEGIKWHDADSDDDSWEVVSCADSRNLAPVLERLRAAQTNHGYDLFLANCEQFGRYVIEGRSYSTQVRSGVFIGGIIAATAFFVTRD